MVCRSSTCWLFIQKWWLSNWSRYASWGVTSVFNMDSRLEANGDWIPGEWDIDSDWGVLFLELGGVMRNPPRRIWQVGQIFTKREMSSFGTLWFCQHMAHNKDEITLFSGGIECRVFNIPWINPADLSWCFIPTAMLTLLVCFREYLKEFLTNRYWFSFMAQYLWALLGNC